MCTFACVLYGVSAIIKGMKYFKTWFGVKKSAAGTTADDANAFTRLELFGLAYGLPLALAGIIWLAFFNQLAGVC